MSVLRCVSVFSLNRSEPKCEGAHFISTEKQIRCPRYKKENYREVHLYLTHEIEVFHTLLERYHAKNRNKQHIKHFNLRSKDQLDHPVQCSLLTGPHCTCRNPGPVETSSRKRRCQLLQTSSVIKSPCAPDASARLELQNVS